MATRAQAHATRAKTEYIDDAELRERSSPLGVLVVGGEKLNCTNNSKDCPPASVSQARALGHRNELTSATPPRPDPSGARREQCPHHFDIAVNSGVATAESLDAESHEHEAEPLA